MGPGLGYCARTVELVAARQLGKLLSHREISQADAALQRLRCGVGHLTPGDGARGERIDGGRARAQQRELVLHLGRG